MLELLYHLSLTLQAAKSVFGDCGSNVTGLDYGVISSPNFPANYEGPSRGVASRTCNWFVAARPQHKIVLNFEFFAVEGDPAGKINQINYTYLPKNLTRY